MQTKPRNQKENAPIWSKRITELMENNKMTNSDLAAQIGVSPQTVSYITSGRPNGKFASLSQETLIKICKVFNVSSDYILGLSQASSLNVKYQAICKALGLSEKAVQNLFDIGQHKSSSCIYSTEGKSAFELGFSIDSTDSLANTTSLILEDTSLINLIHEYMTVLPDQSKGVLADMVGSAILKLIDDRLSKIRDEYQKSNFETLYKRKHPELSEELSNYSIGFNVEAPEGATLRVIQDEKLYSQLFNKIQNIANTTNE